MAGRLAVASSAYRERVFGNQQEIGLFAPDAVLSRDDPDVLECESLSGDERCLYARMMGSFAGSISHADHPSVAVSTRWSGSTNWAAHNL